MQITRVVVFTFGVLVAAAGHAPACDLCAIYTAMEAQGSARTGLFLGAAEQFTHFGTLQFDGREVPNPSGQRLDSSIAQAIVGYSFTQRFSLQANVPLIYRSFKRPEGFTIDEGSESGLGDVSVLGKFLVWRLDTEDFTVTWNLLGGVKFPTGSTSRLQEELHETEVEGAPESGIHGHDLTLGTGSFDGLVGTSAYLRYRRLFATGTVQYSIRSEGDYDYRFANDLTWSGGPGGYLLLAHTYTLALQAVVAGEHKGTDSFHGQSAVDTGITSVYLGPKLIATWKDRLSADVGIDLPVSIENTALQAVPDFRVRAGLAWRF